VTQEPEGSAEPERRRLQRFAQTIAIFLLFVLVFVFIHYAIFHKHYNDALKNYDGFFIWNQTSVPDGPIFPIIVLAGMILTMAVAAFLGGERTGFMGITFEAGERLLRWLVIGMGALTGAGLAFICYYSGGTTDSPFLPLLITYGFIAVVFADDRRTKGVMGFGTVPPYIAFYNQPYGATHQLPRSMFIDGWEGITFATVIVVISIGLTFLTYVSAKPWVRTKS